MALEPHQSNGLLVELVEQFPPSGHPLICERLVENWLLASFSVTIRVKLLLSHGETHRV